MRRCTPALLGLFALAAFACGGETICTLVGCNSQLAIEVLGPDGGPAPVRTATITAAFGNQVAIDCLADARTATIGGVFWAVRCTDRGVEAQFDASGFQAVEVALETTDGAHFEGEVDLEVVNTIFPNGPECGPVCTELEARVTAE